MALNGEQLGREIVAAIRQAITLEPKASTAQQELIWKSIGTAIVAHITANAQVNVLPTNAGLQTSTAPGNPTAGPAAPIPLLPPGVIT
jgi:hypothetical protein